MSTVLFQKTSSKIIQKYSKQGFTGADLHFHTEFSMDAISKIENVLHLAKKKNIGFAVTDHNQIGGAVKAIKLKKQKKQDTLVIPAVEATCKEGA
ncbi:MAG: PHP domain-containing protein, partial [Nanoarchaeota archaeon]